MNPMTSGSVAVLTVPPATYPAESPATPRQAGPGMPPHPQQIGTPACQGADVALFFPEQGHREDGAVAAALCARCEVRRACLDYAIAIREQHGIWGGLTLAGRRSIRTGAAR